MRSLILFFIRIYQVAVSPVMGPTCRFSPTCSVYAYAAMVRYGLIEGGSLALKRILRCHQFNKGGYDPVP